MWLTLPTRRYRPSTTRHRLLYAAPRFANHPSQHTKIQLQLLVDSTTMLEMYPRIRQVKNRRLPGTQSGEQYRSSTLRHNRKQREENTRTLPERARVTNPKRPQHPRNRARPRRLRRSRLSTSTSRCLDTSPVLHRKILASLGLTPTPQWLRTRDPRRAAQWHLSTLVVCLREAPTDSRWHPWSLLPTPRVV
jgi:hypothetical protein